MTIYNLGSSMDYGYALEKTELDRRLDDVLDWLDGTDHCLGEIIDRMQHLNSLRNRSAKGERNPFGPRPRDTKRPKIDPDTVKRMRNSGLSYREISKTLQCSVGLAHRLANGDAWGGEQP